MKRFWTIAGIATLVAVLGVTALGAVAFAQDGEEGVWPFDFRGKFRERVAKLLGVTVEDYDEAVQQARQDVVDQALEEGWLTEDQAERMRERAELGMGPGHPGGRGKALLMRGARGLLDTVADELDMTPREVLSELQEGKSIAELVGDSAKLEAITAAYLQQVEEDLNQAVEDGRITQKQADWMLEQAGEKLPDALNNTWEDQHPGGFPGGGRPGRMWGFPGQTDT